MDCKIGALLIISTQVFATLAASSPCACTRELRPVCGSNGETYNNPCLLRCAAHTSGKEIDVIKSIPCDEEPSLEEPSLEEQNNCICTFNYSPVCGSDGQTYSNECGLNCHRARFNNALKVKYTGPCRTPRQSPCICTLEYNPVCGSNGRTYGNRCGLNCEMKTNTRLRFTHNGPCAGIVKGL